MISGIAQKFNLKSLTGRSKVVAQNAIISLFLKGFTIAVSFVFVPLYLNSVGKRQYGIILTITSISNFISFFDVGIGNGLKTKLGKAIAENNLAMSRYYVSTSYYYVTIFFSSVFAVYCMVSPWVHWHSILNISPTEVNELDKWVFWVVLLFVLRFILQLLSSVLLAYQKSFINDLTQFSTSLIMLIVCYLFKFMHILNFYSLLVVMCGLPVVVLFGYTIFFYATEYKQIRPSLKFVRHDLRKDLFSLGLKFFIIQIVALTIFSTTNILIAQLFDISMVTTYNIAYKYYNITVMVFAILMSPMWGAFTNAWYQGDHKWVRANIKRYVGLVLLLALANVVQHFFYPLFIKTWLKRTLDIPLLLSISFIVYNFIFCYNDIFAHFLASIGQLNRQIYAAVLGGILNIPLTIYLAKHLHLGISAILIANVVCLLPSTIVTTLQTFELLSNKKELKTDQISP